MSKFTACGELITAKQKEWIDKINEQKKHLDKNKKYIFDPFVGFIERKEA